MRAIWVLTVGLVLLASQAASGLTAERVALVIGNSGYQHTQSLANPRNDAQDMAQALRRLSFDVVEGFDLDGESFADLVGRFSSKLQGSRVAVFYYAGHAMQFEDVNYLLPVDAKLRNAFQLKRETIALGDIVAQMEGRAPMSLVFLDACRNNPLAEDLRNSLVAQGRAVERTRGLARETARGRNTLLSFAAGPGREARDGQGRNSPYAAALLKHIETEGLEIETMLKRVSQEVLTATENFQEPERLSRLTEEFYFKPAARSDSQQQAVLEPQQQQNPFGPDALHWSLVKDSMSPQLIREFIGRYPSSPFRNDAEFRLKALEEMQSSQSQGSPDRTLAFLDRNMPAGADDRYAFSLPQTVRQKVTEALRREGLLSESVDDYIRNGADSFALRFAVIKFQKAQSFPQTGYLLREQVARLLASDSDLGQIASQNDSTRFAALFSQTVSPGDNARSEFQQMALSEVERLRIARALESMGLTNGQFPVAFVEQADPDATFSDAIRRFQQGRGFAVTGYPNAEQVRYLVSLGDKKSSYEIAKESGGQEANLVLAGFTTDQLIVRAKVALGDTSEGEGWREKLKEFQRSNGFEATGKLSEPVFLRLLDKSPKVPAPGWKPDDTFKDWSYWQQTEGEKRCYIWTFASAVQGRHGLTELPDLTLSRVPTWPERHLSATFGKSEWFDESKPARIIIDGRTYELTTREGYFWPRITGDNEYSDELTIAMSKATEPATIIGTSRFGGELALTFSTQGFIAAFRRMDERCARNTLSEWLQ